MKGTWEKIRNFKVSSGSEELSFQDRLARENGWTLGFASRVYDEYLRFVYLAISCDHAVTPSEAVDQAWHLHLCNSRSYWEDLCEDVLGRKLHHNPTGGGSKERERYLRQYEDTLRSYSETFGGRAPAEIWPDPKARFASTSRTIRVDLKDSYVVPKKWLHLGILGLSSLLLLSSCQRMFDGVVSGDPLSIAIVILFVVIIWLAWRFRRDGGDGSGCGGDLGGDSGCGSGCGGD